MKPAPVPTTIADDLLRESTAWVAAAVARDLAGPLAALRANTQAARRLLARDCPESPALTATLADMLDDADRLEQIVAALQSPPANRFPRSRLQPEHEVAAAVSLVTGSPRSLAIESDERAPRTTGRPGLIGAAVLHLLLSRPATAGCRLKALRPRPACLVVQLVAAGPAAPTSPLHATAAAAAVSRLGGSLDLDAAGGPCLEIPLEL